MLVDFMIVKSQNLHKKVAAEIPGHASEIPGHASESPGQAVLVHWMLGVSLSSRVFSSASLMEGEAALMEQDMDGMEDADLLAELKMLEAHGVCI